MRYAQNVIQISNKETTWVMVLFHPTERENGKGKKEEEG